MRPACLRWRPRHRGLSRSLNSECVVTHSERLFRREAETSTRHACATNHGLGRGAGVGRALGVTAGLAVGVGPGVIVGVAVAVALGVEEAVAVAVGVGVGVIGGLAVGVGHGSFTQPIISTVSMRQPSSGPVVSLAIRQRSLLIAGRKSGRLTTVVTKPSEFPLQA